MKLEIGHDRDKCVQKYLVKFNNKVYGEST